MYIEEEENSTYENDCFVALGYESDSEAYSDYSDYQYSQKSKPRKAKGKEPMYRNDYPPWEHRSRYPPCENCEETPCARTVRCNNNVADDDSYWNPINSDQYKNPDDDDHNLENMSYYDTLHAYKPTQEEIHNIFLANLKEKQVIAGQPIRNGGSRCTFECDTDNHHIHNYCTACKRNLPYGTIVHDCVIGFTLRKIRPGMDPHYLISVPWWKEPLAVQQQNIHSYYQEIPYYQFTLVLSLLYEPYIADLD